MNFQSRDATTAPAESDMDSTTRRARLADAYATRPFLSAMATIAVLAAIYCGLIAAPMYVSEAKFTIQGQQTATQTGLITGFLFSQTPTNSDAIAVQNFVQSHEMFEVLDKQFHLRQSYSRFRIDPLNWLPRNAGDAAYLNFFRKMVRLSVDRDSGLLLVQVRTFDRATAGPAAEVILHRTEDFVDIMTQRMRSETMRAAQDELNKARADLEKSSLAVKNFRGAASSVDPSGSGTAVLNSESNMEAQAAGIEAELAAALTFNKPESPQVTQIRARLASTRAAAAALRARQGGGGILVGQVTAFEALVAQRAADAQRLVMAQTGYESARAVAQQRAKYVVRVINPSNPDRPTEPERIRDFLMVMVFALAGYSIISLLLASIRDHRGI